MGGAQPSPRPLRVLVVTTGWPGPDGRLECIFVTQQTEFLRREGVDADLFAFEGRTNPLRYAQARRRVRKRLRSGNYDLIHTHFGQCCLLAVPSRIPVVATLHGDDLIGIIGPGGRHSLRGRVLRAITLIASRLADRVVLVSASMAAYLPAGVRHTVVPMGVDTDVFRPEDRSSARAALGLDPNRPYVLFVGDPEDPRKRISLAREAVELVARSMDVELLSVWGVPRGTVARYMNAADVLAVTSLHEGGPLVSKEALACGLPVVSVNVGDAEQLLPGLEPSVLCADDDASTVAEALASVLRDRRRVDETALARVDDRAFVKQLIALYEDVLRSASTARAASR